MLKDLWLTQQEVSDPIASSIKPLSNLRVEYYRNGGILHTVLRKLVKGA